MKILRWVLVVVLAALIVRWLRSLGNDTQFSESKVFSPLWNRLVTTEQWDIAWTEVWTTNTLADDTNWWDPISRIWEELIPELSYWSLSTQWYSIIINEWKVLWNKNADYLMLQYCDYTMKYCRQAQRDWAFIAYQDAFNSNLWYMLKPFLLEENTISEAKHHALQCAQQSWNESQINRMHALLFDLNDRNDIRKAGKNLKINWFESCFLNESSLISVIKQRTLARELFDIKQLPSFVLIDTRSLDRTLIPGLYKEELVVAYLQQL